MKSCFLIYISLKFTITANLKGQEHSFRWIRSELDLHFSGPVPKDTSDTVS